MAGSTLGIGTSGLLTAQRQLATTSHNISNVNTEGFSRQRAEQAARPPQFSGNGYIGTGVDVQTTVRLANEFLEKQVRDSNSTFGQYDAFYALSTQIDNILANPDSGLTPTMESFFSALQEANDNPASTPARQVLLTEANTMTERFKLLDDRFIQLNNQVNQQLVDLTQEVSDAARSVAELNLVIVQRIGAGQGDMPNDLMDQREALIKEIAENVDVSVIYQDDGSANLFIGSGQSLVIGGRAAVMSTTPSQFNAEDLDIILSQGSGSINITKAITGGELQGVLDFKESVLETSRRSLGRVAIALTEEMNAQHRLGMTLQGTSSPYPLGQDFFTDLSGPIKALPGQTGGTGDVEFSITNSRVLSTSNYQLDFSSPPNSYTLRKLDDPSVTYTAANITALNTAMSAIEGFTFADPLPSAPLDGESFLVRPTFTASSGIGVSVNNVLDIALASPVVSGAFTNPDGSAVNTGNGKVSLPVNTSIANIPITDIGGALVEVVLTYDDAAKVFNISTSPAAASPAVPAGPIAYDNTNASDIGGLQTQLPAPYDNIQFTLSGIPGDGDRFVIENNNSPFDDNRNGLLMSKLQTTKTLENSSTDFQSGYAMIVSDVGTKTHSAEIDLLAQQTLSEQAKATRESYSGVNLDEEAADLLKFQQAYQAAARVISSADEMFQTLIAAV